MRRRMIQLAIAVAMCVALPTAAALAAKPADPGKPTAHPSATGVPSSGKPDKSSNPATSPDVDTDTAENDEDENTPETAGDRPHNHGWYVSQVAKDKSTTGRAHGQAVSAVAQSDQGK